MNAIIANNTNAAFVASFAKSSLDHKAEDVFNIVASTAIPVEFNTNWSNGTGYLNGIVTDTTLSSLHPVGSVLGTTCPAGRAILIVPTAVGNVAVFQRYSDRTDVLVCNMPEGIRKLYPDTAHSALSLEDVQLLLGLPRLEGSNYCSLMNIGKRVASFLKLAGRIAEGAEICLA